MMRKVWWIYDEYEYIVFSSCLYQVMVLSSRVTVELNTALLVMAWVSIAKQTNLMSLVQ